MNKHAQWIILIILVLAVIAVVFYQNRVRLSPEVDSNELTLCNQIGWDCPENNPLINDCLHPPLPTWEWCKDPKNGYGCGNFFQDPAKCLKNAYEEFRECLYGNPGLGCPSSAPNYCQCKADCARSYMGAQRGCECHRLQKINCGKRTQVQE